MLGSLKGLKRAQTETVGGRKKLSQETLFDREIFFPEKMSSLSSNVN